MFQNTRWQYCFRTSITVSDLNNQISTNLQRSIVYIHDHDDYQFYNATFLSSEYTIYILTVALDGQKPNPSDFADRVWRLNDSGDPSKTTHRPSINSRPIAVFYVFFSTFIRKQLKRIQFKFLYFFNKTYIRHEYTRDVRVDLFCKTYIDEWNIYLSTIYYYYQLIIYTNDNIVCIFNRILLLLVHDKRVIIIR